VKQVQRLSTELVSPEVELDEQEVEGKINTIKDIEREKECPRCFDVMALSSDFEESRRLRMVTLLKSIEVQLS
jgi:hypothetical protein